MRGKERTKTVKEGWKIDRKSVKWKEEKDREEEEGGKVKKKEGERKRREMGRIAGDREVERADLPAFLYRLHHVAQCYITALPLSVSTSSHPLSLQSLGLHSHTFPLYISVC